MAIQQQGLTLEEFLKLPEEEPELEFVNGVVTQKVPPKFRHSTLQGVIVERVNRFAVPSKVAFAFPELRVTFAGESVVPDVSVFLWNRVPVDAAGEVVEDALEPPDIAVEIHSPDQSVRSQRERCAWYVGNGVWISVMVLPRDRTVTLFRPSVPPVVLRGADPIDLTDVLPGFELTVDDLFGALRFR